MTTTSTANRTIEQNRKYALRRWFWRDVLLRPIGFRCLVVPHVTGLENVPASGGTILMMNHTIAIDGVIVLGVIPHRHVIPLLKIENFDESLIGFLARQWGALSIERGEIDRDALRTMTEFLEAGELLLIAPEGTRQAQLQQPKDGLVYMALKTDAVIVPTAISNGESWAYDIRRPWRRTHMNVDFGKAFRLRKPESKRVPREVMHQMTTEMMYQLAALLPEHYRGEFSDLEKMTTEYLDFLK